LCSSCPPLAGECLCGEELLRGEISRPVTLISSGFLGGGGVAIANAKLEKQNVK
jgi:hypothetical protein